jgi:hypothetical protein
MPLDPELSPDGVWELYTVDHEVYTRKSLLPMTEGYVPHWSTCTNPKGFRKREPGEE